MTPHLSRRGAHHDRSGYSPSPPPSRVSTTLSLERRSGAGRGGPSGGASRARSSRASRDSSESPRCRWRDTSAISAPPTAPPASAARSADDDWLMVPRALSPAASARIPGQFLKDPPSRLLPPFERIAPALLMLSKAHLAFGLGVVALLALYRERRRRSRRDAARRAAQRRRADHPPRVLIFGRRGRQDDADPANPRGRCARGRARARARRRALPPRAQRGDRLRTGARRVLRCLSRRREARPASLAVHAVPRAPLRRYRRGRPRLAAREGPAAGRGLRGLARRGDFPRQGRRARGRADARSCGARAGGARTRSRAATTSTATCPPTPRCARGSSRAATTSTRERARAHRALRRRPPARARALPAAIVRTFATTATPDEIAAEINAFIDGDDDGALALAPPPAASAPSATPAPAEDADFAAQLEELRAALLAHLERAAHLELTAAPRRASSTRGTPPSARPRSRRSPRVRCARCRAAARRARRSRSPPTAASSPVARGRPRRDALLDALWAELARDLDARARAGGGSRPAARDRDRADAAARPAARRARVVLMRNCHGLAAATGASAREATFVCDAKGLAQLYQPRSAATSSRCSARASSSSAPRSRATRARRRAPARRRVLRRRGLVDYSLLMLKHPAAPARRRGRLRRPRRRSCSRRLA